MQIFKKIKSKITKQYMVYHLRWQISALVMLPFMLFLEIFLPLWANLMVGQFIGALIFWSVDKYIFKHHDKDSTEKELGKALEPENSERKL